MLDKKTKNILKKQKYGLVGDHSAVQICHWTKKSLIDEGVCYKEQFYGIKSHLCCQMSPFILCQNKCAHCWRPIEITKKSNIKNLDNPKKIIEDVIKKQRKLLIGFKGNKKINMKKFDEAQFPNQFAISLIGEPTLYPKLPEMIKILRKNKISSFIVSNGLCPEMLKKLEKENALPTQLYISMNSPNKKMYEEWHQSKMKNAWDLFNESLKIVNKLTENIKTRTVLRMTLVKDENMKKPHIKEYSSLIKKALPDFIEIKSYMALGFARKKFDYEKMPFHEDIREFSKLLVSELKKSDKTKKYKLLDEKPESRVILIGENKSRMKIKQNEI